MKQPNVPLADKAAQVGQHVQEKVQPLLKQTAETVQAYVDRYVRKGEEVKED